MRTGLTGGWLYKQVAEGGSQDVKKKGGVQTAKTNEETETTHTPVSPCVQTVKEKPESDKRADKHRPDESCHTHARARAHR